MTAPKQIKVYLDTMMASAMFGGPLADSNEHSALQKLVTFQQSTRIEFFYSAEVLREIERTRNQALKAQLSKGLATLERVKSDHVVVGFHSQNLGHLGYITCPLVSDVVDESMFTALTALGFKKEGEKRDARHFINAVHNRLDVLLTTDTLLMTLRSDLQTRYPSTRIMKPTELLTDLGEPHHSDDRP